MTGSVDSGNSGDICRRILERETPPWLNEPSYGDGRPSRRFGLQFATVPICSGTRSGYGREIGPRCRGSEIARPCGAAVGQERPSGKPGGLFLWRAFRLGLDFIKPLPSRRGLAGILHRLECREFDVVEFAVHFLDLADVDVLHDVARGWIDRNRAARALPALALHRIDQRVAVGLAGGLPQGLID